MRMRMKSYLINGLLCLSFCAGAMPSDQAKPTLVGESAATDSLHMRICPIDSLPCPDGKTSPHERYVSNYERRGSTLSTEERGVGEE